MMTGQDLADWRDRLNLTNQEAAGLLGLSVGGFRKQVDGQRPVSPQTEKLATLLEQKGKSQ